MASNPINQMNFCGKSLTVLRAPGYIAKAKGKCKLIQSGKCNDKKRIIRVRGVFKVIPMTSL